VAWTLERSGEFPAWLPVQHLAAPGDNVGKFDVVALGNEFVAVHEANQQIYTRVISGQNGTLSPCQLLAADDLSQRCPALASSGKYAYLAFLASATPALPVGTLRLYRSSDGRTWERLPELELREHLLFRAKLAVSGRRLLVLIAGENDKLALYTLPLPHGS
jgi:hypothetical protein